MSIADTANALAVAEQLPPDLMLLKMENESIMAVAQARPRDPMKIVKQLQELIDAYPAAADDALYSKPVGTVQEVTCGKCGIKYEVNKVTKDTACPECNSRDRKEVYPVQKFAEGLSIRAAESIRSIFGYTRLATTCEILDDGSARLTGVLVDYAAGNVTSDERIVSRSYRSQNGPMVTIAEDRFLNVTVKAEKSKLRRDVILDSTPGIVKAMYRDACEQKMAALVSPEVIAQKIIPAFAGYGITPAHLDRIVGSPHALGWKKDERLLLRKILTALKNEETTPRELLADLDGAAQSVQKPAGGGATMDDLTTSQTPPQAAQASASGAQEPSFNPPTPQEQSDAEGSQVDPAVDKAEGVDEAEPTSEQQEAHWAGEIEKAIMQRDLNTVAGFIGADQWLNDGAIGRLNNMVEEKREAIRSKRGSKSNA